MDLSGAVLLSKPDTAAAHARKQLTNLIRVGGKLAVLGVEDSPGAAMGRWHVCRPGTWSMPQGNSGGMDQQGADLTYAKALCGRRVVSNGYSADFKPPVGLLCPACREQL
jgi:hypothetical protein